MLEKAQWAAGVYSRYARDDVLRIAEAAADALVDLQVIGAAGRLFISGDTAAVEAAGDRITAFLEAIPGRAS